MRLGLAVGVMAIAVGFACLPFGSGVRGYKGTGSAALSCSAPIVIGWAGGNTEHSVPGGVEYDASQQCGHDARERLVVVGLVMLGAIGAMSVTLWRGLRGGYPLDSTW